jgi:hypothetical protein
MRESEQLRFHHFVFSGAERAGGYLYHNWGDKHIYSHFSTTDTYSLSSFLLSP